MDETPSVRGASVLSRGARLLARAAREQPRSFLAGTLGSVVFASATVGSAYVMSALLARLAAPAFRGGRFDAGAAALAVVAVLTVAGVKIGGILVRRLAVGRMQYALVADYRRRVLRWYLDGPYAWHLRQSAGRLLSRAGSDVDITWAAVANLPLAAGALAICLLSVWALLLTDVALAVVGIAVFPVIILLNASYSRVVAQPTRRVQQLRAELADVAQENIQGAHLIRVLGRGDHETVRLEQAAGQLRDAVVGVARKKAVFDQLMDFLPQFGTLSLLLVGSLRLREGAIGVEQLLSATLLFSAIAFPLGGLGWMLSMLPGSVAGWERVSETLSLGGEHSPWARHESESPDRQAPAALEARNLSFAYSPDRPVVREVTVDLRPGRILAVTGPTGSGKTTLTHLMAGLLRPDSGSVLLDGVAPQAIHPAELPRQIGYVPQDVFLFAGTVRANVALDQEHLLSDDELWQILRAVEAEDFVRALPQGLDTAIAERGGTLSGGQRQRLALARALAHRPRLLILDDATSALDARVEAAVMTSLRHMLPVSTVITTTRQETLNLADEVLFLADGRIRCRGTHRELLAESPEYAQLVSAHTRGRVHA